jgi:hypothetical protein
LQKIPRSRPLRESPIAIYEPAFAPAYSKERRKGARTI